MLKFKLMAASVLACFLFACTDPGPGASSSSSSGGGASSTSSSSSSSGMPSCQNGAANYPTCDKFPLQVVITEPKSLATVGQSPLKVKGTVSKPGAILVVNGTTIEYTNGKFEANVPIEDGYNVITAGVTLGTEQTSDTISVSFDKTPPYVTVESHTDGQTVTTNSITVTGLVNDIVRGTIEAQQAQVRVNGVSAQVSNRSYAAKNIQLQEGSNTLQITAADQVGNTESISIKVIYKKPLDKRIELAGGQDQTASIDSPLPSPLSVKLVDASNTPVANTPVVFRVIQDSGGLADIAATAPQNDRAVMVKTNSQGIAQAKFKVGLRTGVANNKVKATAVGFEGSVIFNASATTKFGDKLSVNSGNNQRGSIGQVLPAPFITVVTDEGANTVKGARVQFEVIKGGGHFENNQTRTEAVTDSDGRASVRYILGEEEGLDAQHVRATLLDGTPGKTIIAGFNATAFKAGDPGQTSVTGVVLDNQDKPIPGITLLIKGTSRKVQSNDQGRFEITSAPVGPIELIADGSTAQVAGEYPNLSFHLVTVAGAKNPLPAPIYMVKLNTKEAVFAGPKDVELTLEKYPGFKLEIAKNSVTFPDGAREGYISVTAVNAAAVPMAPPNGMQPRFIVTIQPTNTRFDAPARLTLPNVDGHKPGAQVEMYSYDHDLEEFVSIGLGTVSEDGTVVKSNPGVGVIKAGWHCGSQPGGSGTAEDCPLCQKCDGTTCKKDPAQNDTPLKSQTPGDCRTATCGGWKAADGDKKPNTDPGDCTKPGCSGGNETTDAADEETPKEAKEDSCLFCKDKHAIERTDHVLRKNQDPHDCKEKYCDGKEEPLDETLPDNQQVTGDCAVLKCLTGKQIDTSDHERDTDFKDCKAFICDGSTNKSVLDTSQRPDDEIADVCRMKKYKCGGTNENPVLETLDEKYTGTPLKPVELPGCQKCNEGVLTSEDGVLKGSIKTKFSLPGSLSSATNTFLSRFGTVDGSFDFSASADIRFCCTRSGQGEKYTAEASGVARVFVDKKIFPAVGQPLRYGQLVRVNGGDYGIVLEADVGAWASGEITAGLQGQVIRDACAKKDCIQGNVNVTGLVGLRGGGKLSLCIYASPIPSCQSADANVYGESGASGEAGYKCDSGLYSGFCFKGITVGAKATFSIPLPNNRKFEDEINASAGPFLQAGSCL